MNETETKLVISLGAEIARFKEPDMNKKEMINHQNCP